MDVTGVSRSSSLRIGVRALLHLNGQPVGSVTVQGFDSSWAWGHFLPGPGFGEFALIFGRWSLLMHADEKHPLGGAASSELREAELEMDALHARLYFEDGSWRQVGQLNIDGPTVEWKEV